MSHYQLRLVSRIRLHSLLSGLAEYVESLILDDPGWVRRLLGSLPRKVLFIDITEGYGRSMRRVMPHSARDDGTQGSMSTG